MSLPENQLTAGVGAFRAYVTQIGGWLEAEFVPENVYEQGVQIVMSKWDSTNPTGQGNPDSDATLYAACGMDLYQHISQAGYGSRVTLEQCTVAATNVVTAVLQARG